MCVCCVLGSFVLNRWLHAGLQVNNKPVRVEKSVVQSFLFFLLVFK